MFLINIPLTPFKGGIYRRYVIDTTVVRKLQINYPLVRKRGGADFLTRGSITGRLRTLYLLPFQYDCYIHRAYLIGIIFTIKYYAIKFCVLECSVNILDGPIGDNLMHIIIAKYILL